MAVNRPHLLNENAFCDVTFCTVVLQRFLQLLECGSLNVLAGASDRDEALQSQLAGAFTWDRTWVILVPRGW